MASGADAGFFLSLFPECKKGVSECSQNSLKRSGILSRRIKRGIGNPLARATVAAGISFIHISGEAGKQIAGKKYTEKCI
jgi:hypothetical protein